MRLAIFISLTVLSMRGLQAQQQNPVKSPNQEDGKAVVVTAWECKKTQAVQSVLSKEDLERLRLEEKREMQDRIHRPRQKYQFTAEDGPQYGTDLSSVQRTMGSREAQMPIKVKWDGQDGNADPLDPSGSAGLTKYVQAVNATPFAVYDKSGTGTPVFTGDVGTITGTGQDGDPIVLYDKFADRWLIAQLDAGNGFAMAISTTNDPAGTYTAYKFTAPQMPDYLKFSVWENGYYMTSNNGGGIVYCFERAAMLAGNPNARAIYKTFTEPANAGFGFFLPLPADADGLIPPSGARCPLFAYTDNGWGSGQIDGVKVWSMGVTWGTTPTADITLDATIPTAAFDASYDNNWDDITQPGNQKLDGIGGVAMYRAQWNNFVGTNRVVLNWGVKVSASQRSIKWVELRQDQNTNAWSLYQEGIYAPDNANRWIGSIAMDCNGDIALCYAKASSSISPCLAYTGRVPSDPPGVMSLTETVAFPGQGSKTGGNRFGDYAHTSIDPVDGLTFWHTGMYAKNGATTGIYSFQIATSCTIGMEEKQGNEIELKANYGTNVIQVHAQHLPLNKPMVVELFELQGKKVTQVQVSSSDGELNLDVNTSDLAKGIYLLRVGNPDFQKVIKVLIP